MPELFDQYNEEAFKAGITPKTKESIAWFQEKLQSISSVNRRAMMEEGEKLPGPVIGSMVMFFYDPKLKKKLPYYDRFPLSIIIDKSPGGFMGINLHYLPIDLRAKFLDGLLDLVNNEEYDESTKFNVTYDYLKSSRKYRFFKPCLKQYLTKHIDGNIVIIEPSDWLVATFLPSELFRKESKEFVHAQSRKKLR
jgi:hypothetical protein